MAKKNHWILWHCRFEVFWWRCCSPLSYLTVDGSSDHSRMISWFRMHAWTPVMCTRCEWWHIAYKMKKKTWKDWQSSSILLFSSISLSQINHSDSITVYLKNWVHLIRSILLSSPDQINITEFTWSDQYYWAHLISIRLAKLFDVHLILGLRRHFQTSRPPPRPTRSIPRVPGKRKKKSR